MNLLRQWCREVVVIAAIGSLCVAFVISDIHDVLMPPPPKELKRRARIERRRLRREGGLEKHQVG